MTWGLEAIGREVVDSAVKIHRKLGNGLLESAYEICMEYELQQRGLTVERQVPMNVMYETIDLGACYRLDILIEKRVILEIKAADEISPVHKAQLLSYLKLGDFRLGSLLNFHAETMKDGIKRMRNDQQLTTRAPWSEGGAKVLREERAK